jgi:hypothetical protein
MTLWQRPLAAVGRLFTRPRRRREAVLALLEERGETDGRLLRNLLKERGFRTSLAGFYAMLARLEDAGRLVRRKRCFRVGGRPVCEFRYSLPEKEVARDRSRTGDD